MNYIVPTIIVLVILLGLLGLMWWGWNARRRRDSAHARYAVPADLGAPSVDVEGFYVATTAHERPLDRLALPGLRYRAKARIAIGAQGVTISIPGEQPTWIPAGALRGAGAATYAVDRVVEDGGLVCISWQLAAEDDIADSYVRVTDAEGRAAVLAALQTLLPASTESEA